MNEEMHLTVYEPPQEHFLECLHWGKGHNSNWQAIFLAGELQNIQRVSLTYLLTYLLIDADLSEYCINISIVQLYHGENKLHIMCPSEAICNAKQVIITGI
jgi:hypothetical protein